MTKRLVPAVDEVIAVQWGPDKDAMLGAAEFLGSRGMQFDIKFTSPEDKRRGIDVYPELHLFDDRFRVHVVTRGLWIVVYPGFRQFRVVTTERLQADYEEK